MILWVIMLASDHIDEIGIWVCETLTLYIKIALSVIFALIVVGCVAGHGYHSVWNHESNKTKTTLIIFGDLSMLT